jgi:hypothetical protein
MATTGRRRSTPRARAEAAVATAAVERELVADVAPAVELLEDHSTSIAGTHGRRSLGRSVTGAVAGTLLVVGLAFGAALGPGGSLGQKGDGGGAAADAAAGDTATTDGSGGAGSYGTDGGAGDDGNGTNDEHESGGPDATSKPDATGATDKTDGDHPDATEKPAVEPTDKPDPTPKPTPKPTVKPAATPKPVAEPIALALAIKEFHPFLEWGSCEGLDFDYYKVVRSTDSTASWPGGEGDELIAAVEPGGARKAYDKGSPHSVKVWYRVFCVRKTEDGYKVLRSSATKGIEVPEEPAPPPAPDPVTLGLDAGLTDGGKVVLDWSACEVDGFAFYKVVGSTSTEDPSYLPWHDGTEVLGVVSEQLATQLEVWAPDAGHTAWYRVQCLGYVGDQKVLLGESAVVAVTVP